MARCRALIVLASSGALFLVACQSPTTSVRESSGGIEATGSVVQPSDAAPPTLTVGGVTPEHGIAYRTASGTAIPTYAGDVLFTVPSLHVVDRSLDTSSMAAVVAFDGGTGMPAGEYALVVGSDVLQPIEPSDDGSPYAAGWTAKGAPDGCLRDARRVGSTVLLCAPAADAAPTQLVPANGVPAVAAVQPSGHWMDAITGPDGYIAATWSGECETLSAYLITPDAREIPLSEGQASAVLAWTNTGALVARFGACGTEDQPPQVLVIGTDGTSVVVPTPGITEAPVAW